MIRASALMPLLLVGTAVAAQGGPIASRLFIEQLVPGSASAVRLVPAPDRLRRGREVVVLVRGVRARSADRGVITSAVPQGLRFMGADSSARVSVDGGRRFGRLPELLIPGGARPARPADVTHVRWTTEPSAQPPFLSFRGVVR